MKIDLRPQRICLEDRFVIRVGGGGAVDDVHAFVGEALAAWAFRQTGVGLVGEFSEVVISCTVGNDLAWPEKN